MQIFKVLCFSLCLLAVGHTYAEEHQIKMLSSLKGQSMVFEPPVIHIKPGDTVKWLKTNPGHNTVSINEMIPEGAEGWSGGMNEEVVIKFEKEGVYGYKCTPHYILGMVGLVVVGSSSSNLDVAKSFAIAEESKFAMNKNRFSDYFSKVK